MAASTDVGMYFRDLVDAEAVTDDAQVAAFAVDGVLPRAIVSPASLDELCRCVAAADAAELALIPVGIGSRLGVGNAAERYDVAICTRRLRRIVAHEAADMTVVAEAGVTLAELNATLAAHGQYLPFDPPHPASVTIGGLIASDAWGPMRLAQGKVRDSLIGIGVVLADGTAIKGGGRVVKNVAGYDLMKLFTGSYGTLGIIVEAAFKVRPRPACEAVFVINATDAADALDVAAAVLAAGVEPQHVEAANGAAAHALGFARESAVVIVGCGGSPEEIGVQRDRLYALTGARTLRSFEGDDARRTNDTVRDFPVDAVTQEVAAGCRVSVRPSRLPDTILRIQEEAARGGLAPAWLAYAGNGAAVLRLDGNGPAAVAFPRLAESVRHMVRAAGGWVVFDALPAGMRGKVDVWGAEAPGLELMRGIKQTLDPRRRLSPGRFVGGI